MRPRGESISARVIDVGRARLEAEPAVDAVEQQLVVNDIAQPAVMVRQSQGSHQTPPTKHPALKTPAGSKVFFSRCINFKRTGIRDDRRIRFATGSTPARK